MAVFRREWRRLLPSIAARPIAAIAAIRYPLPSDKEEGLLGVRSISTQMEALNGVISCALEPVVVKLKTDISKSKERRTTRLENEFGKVQADLIKMRAETVTMEAEQKSAHQICLQKINEDQTKTRSDLGKDFAQLEIEYQSAKLQAVKYAVATLASAVAVTMSWVRLMK